jgi:hypothetical protein
LVAQSAAESLYLLSGMNGTDFIYMFRGWEDLKKTHPKDVNALGPELRFQGQATENVLDYRRSNALRQKGSGFKDQLALAIQILKNRNAREVVIQFASIQNSLEVHNAWFYINNAKLDMLISAGSVEGDHDLSCKIISPFAFLHQIVSDLTNIPMGSSRFMIGRIYSSGKNTILGGKSPIVNMYDFKYPNGGLSLHDVDALMSIMVEFVERLDENNLMRANPFERDDRVMLWSDYAEVFRAWKAEQLGFQINMEQNFYHPQLRFIYKGETV